MKPEVTTIRSKPIDGYHFVYKNYHKDGYEQITIVPPEEAPVVIAKRDGGVSWTDGDFLFEMIRTTLTPSFQETRKTGLLAACQVLSQTVIERFRNKWPQRYR